MIPDSSMGRGLRLSLSTAATVNAINRASSQWLTGMNRLVADVNRGLDKQATSLDQVAQSVSGVTKAVQALNDAKPEGLAAAAKRSAEIGKSLQESGGVIRTAGVSAAAGLGLSSLPGAVVEGDAEIRRMSILRGLSARESAMIRPRLSELARSTNQTVPELIAGLGELMVLGLDVNEAMATLPVVARGATAKMGTVPNLSGVAASFRTNMKVAPGAELERAMSVAAAGGQQGGFDFSKMAEYLPKLTGKASALGMTGERGVAQIVAMLQAAFDETQDYGQAAQRVQDLMEKLAAPNAVAGLKKEGVDMLGIAANRGEPVLEALRRIQEMQGDKKGREKLAHLFPRINMAELGRPLLQNVEQYRANFDAALAGANTVDVGFNAAMEGPQEQLKKLRISLQETARPYLVDMLERVNGWLTTLNAHPIWQRTLLGGVVGLIGVGAAMAAAGQVATALAPVIGGAGKVAKGGSEFRSAYRAGRAASAVEGTATGTVLDLYTDFGRANAPNPAEAAKLTRAGRIGAWASRVPKRWADQNSRMRGGVESYFTKRTLVGRAYAGSTGGRGDKQKAAGDELGRVFREWVVDDDRKLFRKFFPKKAKRINTKGLVSGMAEMDGDLPYLTSAKAFATTTKAVDGLTVATKRSRVATLASAVSAKIVAAAVWVWNSALFANPMVWVAVAAVAAALLVYKYWKPITAFFQGMGVGIRKGLAPLQPHLKQLRTAFAPVINGVKLFFGWLGKLIEPVEGSTKAFSSMGEKVGEVIGAILTGLAYLPVKFLTLGVELVTFLVKGMISVGGLVTDYLSGLFGWGGEKGAKKPSQTARATAAARTVARPPARPATAGARPAVPAAARPTVPAAAPVPPRPNTAGARPPVPPSTAPARPTARRVDTAAMRAPGVVEAPLARERPRERGGAGQIPPIQIALTVALPPGTPKDEAERAQRAFAAAAPQFARMINQTIDERRHREARTSYKTA